MSHPALTAVVFGYRNEATVLQAVASLMEQECGERFEVVVATSGGDRTGEFVRGSYPEVRVEESPTRLLPGGVRNLGMRMARGETVAFLEADCVARPGWVQNRIALHRAGHQAVAGAIGVRAGDSPAARATTYLCFGDRLERTPAGPAESWLSYGLSFTRELLDRAGPFDEFVRVGEDTLMVQRLAVLGIVPWFDPSVCIEHVGSDRLNAMLKEQYQRGRRQSRSDQMAKAATFRRLKWENKRGTTTSVVTIRAIRNFYTRSRWAGRHLWAFAPNRRDLLITLPWMFLGQVAHKIGWGVDQLEYARADGVSSPIDTGFACASLRRRVATDGEKVVALTFDDGPSPYTDQVLRILDNYGIPGSFFMIGERAESFPELTRSVAAAGHTVGIHGWSHRPFTDLDDACFEQELDRSSSLLRKLTGQEVRHVRPPMGLYDAKVVARLGERGLVTWLWTIDPNDWSSSVDTDQIVAETLRNITPGSVILLHDGGGRSERDSDRSRTVASLPALIEGVLARKFRFVSLDHAMRKSESVEHDSEPLVDKQ